MSEKSFNLSGGCHCGSVRYRLLEPPLSVQHCHCESCRKTSGCFFQTAGIMKRDKVIIEGNENLSKYRSSESFEKQFCGNCGCVLFDYDDDETNLFYVHVSTLDGGLNPGHPKNMESHTYIGSKAKWEHVSEAIPHFEKDGPGEIITAVQKTDS